MKLKLFILPFVLSLSLSGCVVGAVADLAATTVVTAGKLAVKGTGALIGAAIPDKDKKKERETSKSKQDNDAKPSNSHTMQTPVQTRYITIDADGNAHESLTPPSNLKFSDTDIQ